MPELKLNLKFEVEVLCKNIAVDIAEIEPSDVLRHIQVRCHIGRTSLLPVLLSYLNVVNRDVVLFIFHMGLLLVAESRVGGYYCCSYWRDVSFTKKPTFQTRCMAYEYFYIALYSDLKCIYPRWFRVL